MRNFRDFVDALNEKSKGEYDNEGGMAKNQLKTMIDAAQELHDSLEDDENLPEWVQGKITKATDYIDTARDYMSSVDKELDEGAEIYIMKKGTYQRKVDGATADRMKKDGWTIAGRETVSEGSETWEAGYKRRVVKTTDPDHKEAGHNWRIKGKDKSHLTIKLYKEKPSQAEFNKQMKRVAGHEFGG